MASDVIRLAAVVEKSRVVLLNAGARLPDDRATFPLVEGQWSICDVIKHLAEMSGLTKMWGTVSAYGQGTRWTAVRPHHGKSIDQPIAETWKAKEAAPPIGMPHIGGPLGCWRSATLSLKPILADLAAEMERVPLEDVTYLIFSSARSICGSGGFFAISHRPAPWAGQRIKEKTG